MPRKKGSKPLNGATVDWASTSKTPNQPLQNTESAPGKGSRGSSGSNSGSGGDDSGDEVDSSQPQRPIHEEIMEKYSGYIYGFGVLMVIMFLLFFFVEDGAVTEHRRRVQAERDRRRDAARANIKEFDFEHAQLLNSTAFTTILQRYNHPEEYFDRMVIAAFDDSTRDAGNDPKRVKLFKKYEGLAKSMPRKKLFQRYDEEELPMVVLFDCGGSQDPMAPQVCQQLIGSQIPTVLIFRRGVKPRPLSSELRSDKAILQYLFDLLQPPVKYLEEIGDVEDFVADDSTMKTVLFGTQSDTYETVADTLREFGSFGRTQSPGAASDYDMTMPQIGVWRTHGSENPVVFNGNMSDLSVVHSFVVNQYLPLLGEFNERTQKMYMRRGLPIIWVAYSSSGQSTALPSDAAAAMAEDDDSGDSSAQALAVESANEQLFTVAMEAARQSMGHLCFVKLDVDYQAELAKNLNLKVKESSSSSLSSKKKNKDKDKDEEDEEDDSDGASSAMDDEDDSGEDDDDSELDTLPQVLIMNQMLQVKEQVKFDDIASSFNSVIGQYYASVRSDKTDDSSSDEDGIAVEPGTDEENEFEDVGEEEDSIGMEDDKQEI